MGLCLAWSETPEDTFCRVVAQLCFVNNCSSVSFSSQLLASIISLSGVSMWFLCYIIHSIAKET